MRLTSLARMVSATAAVGILSTAIASAGIVRGPITTGARHAGPAVFTKIHHDTTCPSTYYECLEISKSSPATQQWCIIYSGTSDCTDLYPGTWTWTVSGPYKAKGGKVSSKTTSKIKASFSPNPGNPTNLNISTKTKKSSKGKIKYAIDFTVCNSSGSCLGPIYIGISIL